MSPSDYYGGINADLTATTDSIDIEIDTCNCDGTKRLEDYYEDDKPQYVRIGDMVYFKNIDKAIPIRKLPKEMRKSMGI